MESERSENEPEDVYGPPVSEEEVSEEDFDVEVNENPAVYGPPPGEEPDGN